MTVLGGTTYYRVLPSRFGARWKCVQTWRWWWPFWVTSVDWLEGEAGAAEWIKGHSTYYDGAA